ncbi:MAG: D-glycero-beta-D-manno-heptose 1-phosphate adenylyltransferase [Flavobacteriales bacterium]|nr:D-glycero-beta-D-manno-heptose 1-phosphate adenylyltransferase [Flavobacteriales bacterium]
MSSLNKIQTKIKNLEDASFIVRNWNSSNEKIVFTNGCFDLLHLGHIDYLSKAKDLGTKLIVGVNSSESVQKLKGPSRPIHSSQTRSTILAAFEFIDLVIIFEEETPIELIKTFRPNILVKGGDYTLETVIGAYEVNKYGGHVEIIPFLTGYSTSSIVTKIQSFSKS